MEKKRIKGFLENSIIVRSIKGGLITIIPVLMIGSFSLMLSSLPFEGYQLFLESFLNGLLLDVFNVAFHATFDMLSVYMTVAIAYNYARNAHIEHGGMLATAITSLACFTILTGFRNPDFSLEMLQSFGVKGMFTAIFASLIASWLYALISKRRSNSRRHFSDGADTGFNDAMYVILPAVVIILLFALFSYVVKLMFKVPSAYDLFSLAINGLFSDIGRNFFSGLLYVVLSSLLWFCGIHGSDMLESVADSLFVPALEINRAAVASGGVAGEILTKQFFDNFVLIGGCGSLLCLLVALFIFSRRRSNRGLAKISVLPMLFNINEMMVFGLPIIFNPIMFIPFMLAPLSSYVISYLATLTGLVPAIANQVTWTTPIFFGGYFATGSIAGSILQLVCLIAGTFIYMPFVKKLDLASERTAGRSMGELVDTLKKSEMTLVPINLTSLEGELGALAKSLVYDLRFYIKKKELLLYYQPQHDTSGACIGAEALLRWDHPVYGMLYPPLVIKIAKESGLDLELEEYLVTLAIEGANKINSAADESVKISVNVSAGTVIKQEMLDFLSTMSNDPQVRAGNVYIEVTEQEALTAGDTSVAYAFSQLQKLGYRLAIDDFSMGHTSLEYLQENSFNMVKLDGWLAQNILENTRCRDMVSSIVALSNSLGFSLCAEYVENTSQRDMLMQMGCGTYQGYLYSPAIPIDAYIDYLKKGSQSDL